MNAEVEEFGRLLVESVRDVAIRSNDRWRDSEDLISRRWREAAAAGPPAGFADILIADVVDSTIGHVLAAIDQGLLPLTFKASNGKSIDLTTIADVSGELSGWYGGEWRNKYSKERFVDDLASLDGFFDKPSPG